MTELIYNISFLCLMSATEANFEIHSCAKQHYYNGMQALTTRTPAPISLVAQWPKRVPQKI